ncbi:ankyrin repeat domain-containing protein [Flavobacterium sp.]|uniref:ankyrin repeat domain-containing protein n=1 Tax=Flavobacterium sp. TaxID=239 RepID=UPI00286D82B4|nr:ankyrin repeat domain-containing protein [Flavobacterium sp.]
MKNKINLYLPIAIVLVLVGLHVYSKVQKDNWVKEAPAIKYSEERENEVWGGVLRGDDAGLFYGTPLYDLADEMSGFFFLRNQNKIARLISELPEEYINYQEEKYGKTIGHFALFTGNLKAIHLLLDRGLNANVLDKNGSAIIIDINAFSYNPSEKLQLLKHMIKKGANVNLAGSQNETPLTRAARSGDLTNVKILINAGANPHFFQEMTVEGRHFMYTSALRTALTYGHINIVNYLIFDQKVDFRIHKYPDWSKFHPGEYEILFLLRDEMRFKLNSKDYKEKLKLVAYLKTQGLDYWKTPIPDNMSSNSNYTQEYLSKY